MALPHKECSTVRNVASLTVRGIPRMRVHATEHMRERDMHKEHI